jgi:hypothetical protein
MEAKDIHDFSDLGDEIFFSYKGKKYAIPQPTRDQWADLLRVNQRISAHVKESSPDKKDGAPEPTGELTEGAIVGMDGLFKLQQEFVVLGVRLVQDNDQRVALTIDEVNTWPIKLLHKVVRMINENMSAPDKEERPT